MFHFSSKYLFKPNLRIWNQNNDKLQYLLISNETKPILNIFIDPSEKQTEFRLKTNFLTLLWSRERLTRDLLPSAGEHWVLHVNHTGRNRVDKRKKKEIKKKVSFPDLLY